MLKRVRKGFLIICLTLLVLATEDSVRHLSLVDLAVTPYQYDLVRWELAHFPDKWVYKLVEILTWNSGSTHQERIARVQEFFALGGELRALERQSLFPTAIAGGPLSEAQAQSQREHIKRIQERRRRIHAEVEEIVESEVSAILSQEGFSSRIGLIFPPVDTVFSSSPHVLVVSPRDRILQQRTTLLTPDITDEEKERLEALVLREENLSALVEGTGGVASYPSVVSDAPGLHDTVVTTAHEWLHHWFFFRPLGRHFWSSPEMTTLNETAATLGGMEIGDRAFQAMTGETVIRAPPPAIADPGAFDFNMEMRRTRLRAEELLSQGKIEEAESYMEERRQLMVANGYLIRKINQAYFAFYGSYATSAASISPIEGQLKELRSQSASLGDFLKTVARFGSYQEFLDYLQVGAQPRQVGMPLQSGASP